MMFTKVFTQRSTTKKKFFLSIMVGSFIFSFGITSHALGIFGPSVQERLINEKVGIALETDQDELKGESFNGKFYVGAGNDPGEAQISVCDPAISKDVWHCDGPADWSHVFNPGVSYETATSLIDHNSRLYIGMGSGSGDGDIFMCNPALTGDVKNCDSQDFSLVFNNTVGQKITDFQYLNGYIYAAVSLGSSSEILICRPSTGGDPYSCDTQSDWQSVYSIPQADTITDLAIGPDYKLYAGLARASTPGAGDVLVCDPELSRDKFQCDVPEDWSLAFDGSQESISSLWSYNLAMYIGQGSGTGDAEIFVCAVEPCTPDQWTSVFHEPRYEAVTAFSVLYGTLYAGMGTTAGDSDLYRCSPENAGDERLCDEDLDWSFAIQGTHSQVNELEAYNGALYSFFGNAEGEGDAWYFLP